MPRKVHLQSALILSDTHVPFHDNKTLKVLYNITEDLQPTHVIHLGDLLDCYSISRFGKDPDRIICLGDEIDEARKVLTAFNTVAPNAKKYLLEGNHENRLYKAICNSDGQTRELLSLRSVRLAMQWPSLLDTTKIGWTFIPDKDQPTTDIIPNLALKHGSVVRKYAGYTAKGEFENYHMSGASGHTHRGGLYSHRTLSGQSHWIETFCTCDLKPSYMNNPNWQSGAWCVTWTSDGLLGFEPIIVDDGVSLFRGNVYKT